VTQQQFPHVTVGALIFNPQGKLFLMKSHKWRNKYVVPGGHIELGETIEDTIKREVKEETGLRVYDIRFLLHQEFIFDKAFWKKRHFIFLDYACKTRRTQVKLNDEAQDYIWVEPQKALKLAVEPYTKIAIKAYLKQNED
jgi:nucleoside triphosphatase